MNWPPLRVKKLTFWALALRQSLWRRANARNVSFFTLYGGQFTFSTQLLTLNYIVREAKMAWENRSRRFGAFQDSLKTVGLSLKPIRRSFSQVNPMTSLECKSELWWKAESSQPCHYTMDCLLGKTLLLLCETPSKDLINAIIQPN